MMKGQGKAIGISNAVILSGGAFPALLGLAVLIGWYTHQTMLMQVHSSFVPMQYNTALGFILSGAALLGLAFQNRRFAILGVLPFVLGLLTLSQYFFGINLGIDELFFKHYVFTKTSHAGRMAPATAFSFMLVGLAVLSMGFRTLARYVAFILSFIGAVLTSVSLVALFGYASGFEAAYSWGDATRMAVHTASGFLALGSALLAVSWREAVIQTGEMPKWLSLPAGIAVLTVSLCLWQALSAYEHKQVEQTVKAQLQIVKNEFFFRMESRILMLLQMGKYWEMQEAAAQEKRESDALFYLNSFPGYQTIEWVDLLLETGWAVSSEGSEMAQNPGPAFGESARAVLERARDSREVRVFRTAELGREGAGFLVLVPVFRNGIFEGFVLGDLRPQSFFDGSALKHLTSGYGIEISAAGERIYARNAHVRQDENELGREVAVDFYGISWRIRMWPLAGTLQKVRSMIPLAVLMMGLGTSLLVSLLIYFSQMSHQRAKALAEGEQRFQSLIRSTGDAIVVADEKGKLVAWNKAAETIFGFTEAEALGQPLALIMPERFRKLHQEGLKRFLTTGEARVIGKVVELVGLKKDAREFPIELSLSTWKTKAGHYFAGIIRDVAERKRQQEVLIQRTEQLVKANEELERFNRIGVERELKMMELKKEIEELKKAAGQPGR